MDKKTMLWIVIALLAIAFVYITFFKGSGTGQAVSAAQTAGQVVKSSSGMVGGC